MKSDLAYYVYVLLSLKDKKFYIGFSTKLIKRKLYHNKGLVKSTINRRPLILIFYEVYNNKIDAIRREKYLKTTTGKRALKIMLKETLKNNKYAKNKREKKEISTKSKTTLLD